MPYATALLVAVSLLTIEARYYSEGGSSAWNDPSPPLSAESMAEIVDQLKALEESGQLFANDDAILQPNPESYESDEPNLSELSKISADLRDIAKEQKQTEETSQPEEEPILQNTGKLSAQKKGQFEFVEFVEPAKILSNIETLDKRTPQVEAQMGSIASYSNSGNVVFIVAVTVCTVGVVAAVVGGVYHINSIRKQRAEAFDDFTRYSPAGPGRDMLRKGRGFAGSPITETGDDTLAYKAQLHHYQQTRQKIIGDDNGLANDDQSDRSDDEAEDLEEHNYSVYECPGLAPTTGDIEVQNPNFNP